MIITYSDQNTEQWLRDRLGIPTASSFDRIFTAKKLSVSAQAEKYLMELTTEWLLQEPGESFSNQWTERGHELEPEAAEWYAFAEGVDVTEVGVVYKDDQRLIGCSPDRLIFDGDIAIHGLEIKCPKASTHLGYLAANKVPDEYMLQVQGSMWVTGLERWDFVSYHPQLENLVLEVQPDERIFQAFDEHIPPFIERLLEYRSQFGHMKQAA